MISLTQEGLAAPSHSKVKVMYTWAPPGMSSTLVSSAPRRSLAPTGTALETEAPRTASRFRQPSPTSDGHIVHGIYKYDHWQRFLAEVGRHDVLDGPLMRDPHAMALNITGLYELAATEILPTRTTEEWRALLDRLDIPSAPVLTMDELEDDPHLKAVGLFEDYEHPTRGPMRHVRLPFNVRDVRRGNDRYPPELGEHGAEVLAEFGFDQAAIDELGASGVLGRGPGRGAA